MILDVFFTFVAEQSNDGLQFRVSFAHLAGGDEVRAAGRTDEETVVFGQEPHALHGLSGVYGEGRVHQPLVALEDSGYEAVGYTFDQVVPHFAAEDGRRLRG